MIQQGLVMMIQAGLNNSVPGGYAGQLPKDFGGTAYAYKVVSSNSQATLQGVRGLQMLRLQIDCFGPKALDAQKLASSIDGIINGFQGTLLDPDLTYVSSCIQDDLMGPDFSETAHNFWVMLQYEIWFNQN